MRSQNLRQTVWNNDFAAGVIPGDGSVDGAVQNARDFSVVDQPPRKRAFLRVVDRLCEIEVPDRAGRRDGKALSALNRKSIQQTFLELRALDVAFSEQRRQRVSVRPRAPGGLSGEHFLHAFRHDAFYSSGNSMANERVSSCPWSEKIQTW